MAIAALELRRDKPFPQGRRQVGERVWKKEGGMMLAFA
jgi:hypothetical protein